jgi:Reverse transcriptase (RNA-dependent DNA polymerase)
MFPKEGELLIDIETTFLHGKLSEDINMNAPEGMDVKGNKCLRLKKIVYGLVQSAREFHKRLICELKDLGFSEKNQTRGIYVNDCLVLGKEKEINKVLVDLELKGFSN